MENPTSKQLYLVVSVILLFFEISNSMYENISCPTEFCNCSLEKEIAECVYQPGRNLNYIPELPNYVKYFVFNRYYLPNITKNTLEPLKHLELQTLTMMKNGIRYISPRAFQNLRSLWYLDLSENKDLTTTTLMSAFQSLVDTNISMIVLNDMNWTTIQPTLFFSLRKNNVTRIKLMNNHISVFNMTYFSYLKYLSQLDISKNDMDSFVSCNSPNLTVLILNDNNLKQVPQICSSHGSYFPKLKTLDLKFNSIAHLNSKTFDCLPHVKNLLLDGNPISKIRNNTFSILPRLEVLQLVSLAKKVLLIESYAFNSSSLLKLNFNQNRFGFRRHTYYPKTIFKACPNLLHLDLSGNILPGGLVLTDMIGPLKQLKKLLLNAVQWRFIPAQFLLLFPALESLILSGNYISALNNNPFAKVKTLQNLDLSGNNLNLINKTSFPPELVKSLKHLNLQKNPFTCTCDLRWFRNWIKSVNFSLTSYPDSYKCVSPPSWKGRLLKEFDPSEESCRPKTINPVELIAIISSAAGLVMIVSIAVIYKCRWHIRYGLYLLRAKRKGYIRIMNEEGFKYDAFVIYCDDDRKWVHEHFLERIEKDEEFRLCIHFRDFKVGKLIVDNISDSIKASRKVCIILSNNFAKSQWCKFELLLAQDRFLKEGTDVLIVVMLEEIEHRYLNGALKTLLTSTTYAVWSCDKVAEQLFWEQIITSLRNPLNYNALNA